MNRDVMIDINLKTRIWVDDSVDEEWIDGLVKELENEAEEKMDMGFSSAWEVRKVEELKEC